LDLVVFWGRRTRKRRAATLLCLMMVTSLTMGGCGRILQSPTATTVAGATVISTSTPWPTATRRATFTPVPATPSATPEPTVTPTPIIYVIAKGDTLIPIARKFGVTVKEITDANGITDPRRLRIGQEIIIPVRADESGPTVVPTPTPVDLQIQGLAFHRTPADSLWCLGEVLNVSGQPAEEVQVRVSLHDEQGQLLVSGAAFTEIDIVPDGGRAPFTIRFAGSPASFAQYQTQVLGGVPSTHLGPRYPDLEVVEDHGEWLDENNYGVRGQVLNSGQFEAEKVAVIITLYDSESHVVGARTVKIPAGVFLAGAVAPFEVELTPLGPVDRYDVQVQGWWIGYEVPVATSTPEATATP
jgi:LysM repeat protein